MLKNYKILSAFLLSFLIIIFSLYVYFYKKDNSKLKSSSEVQEKNKIENDLDTKAKQIEKSLLSDENIFTESTARVMVNAYLVSKKEGKDTQSIEKELNRLAQSVLNTDYNLTSKDDLNIKKNIDLNQYKKEMGKALSKLLQIKEYELDTIAKIVKDKDEQAYLTLAKDIVIYNEVINDLKQIPVNEDLAVPHLQLINSYEKLVTSMELIIKSKNDIILLYPGLKALIEADKGIQAAFEALKWYIEISGHEKLNQ